MYGRCVRLEDALKLVFKGSRKRDDDLDGISVLKCDVDGMMYH